MTARQGQEFPKAARIRRRREFLSFGRSGERCRSGSFVLVVQGCRGQARLGITVSRKVGSAVARNLLKRRIREVFRRHPNRHRLDFDLMVIAKPGAGAVSTEVVRREMGIVLDAPSPRYRSDRQ